ncbi:MAG: hypothetical protein AAF587_28210 [Bacteroidota bacterium]
MMKSLFLYLGLFGFLWLGCTKEQQNKILHQPADLYHPTEETAVLSTARTATTFSGLVNNDSIILHVQYDDSLLVGEAIFVEQQDTFSLQGRVIKDMDTQLTVDILQGDQATNRIKGSLSSNTRWQGEWQHLPEHQIKPIVLKSEETNYHITDRTQSTQQVISVKRKVSRMASPNGSCSLIFEYPSFSKNQQAPAFHHLNQFLKPPNIRQLPIRLSNCISETADMAEGFVRQEEQSYAIHLVSSQIVSVSVLTTIRQGIPGHMSDQRTARVLNLDPVQGMQYESKHLFRTGFEPVVRRLVQTHLTNHYGQDWGIQLDQLHTEQDYEIHADKIVVRFDPGELGEFATEPIRVPISFDAIKDYLHPEGPLQTFL